MSNTTRKMILGGYLSYGTGHHAASWRHPSTPPGVAVSISHYLKLSEIAESALLDFMFLSDTPSVFSDEQEGYGSRVVVFEPMTLLSAIAMKTSNLGLIATSSTTYKEPYNTAREFASLDIISNGRAGWNLVTSSKANAAFNFGYEKHPDHEDRYARAEEFFDVVTGLWDSWDDNALTRETTTGKFYEPNRMHVLSHKGKFFNVRGPLNIPRPPQGHPLVVQAGSSEQGIDLAARTADAVFTAQNDIGRAIEFYSRLQNAARQYKRRDPHVLVLPGICCIAGSTTAAAQAKLDELQSLVPPRLGLSMLSDLLGGVDLSNCDVEGPLPALPVSNGNRSRQKLIESLAQSKKRSIRSIYEEMTIARGHLVVVGSYDHVADVMASWFENGACDGFNVMPPYLPDALIDFAEEVVPRLQNKGLFKRKYSQGTLRQKLGLTRVASRYSNKMELN